MNVANSNLIFDLKPIVKNFTGVSPNSVKVLTNGHLHSTLLVSTSKGELVFQRVNQKIFSDPDGLMFNLGLIQQRLSETSIGIPETVMSVSGKPLFKSETGEAWRCFRYIPNTACYDLTNSPRTAFEGGRLFGTFLNLAQSRLSPDELVDVLPGFQNTARRFDALQKAFERDQCDRAQICFQLVEQLLALRCEANLFESSSKLSRVVVHNDMKLANLLFDKDTQKAGWILDWDTCMAGFWLYDFGDYIRNVSVSMKEDASDLEKIEIVDEFLESGSRGFLSQIGPDLVSEADYSALSQAPLAVVLALAARFLTDYLMGDCYFGITYPEQNLVRARAQHRVAIRLMESQSRLREIVDQVLC